MEILKSIFDKSIITINTPFSSTEYYNEEIEKYDFNLEKAREWMTAAGYDSEEWKTKRIEFNILYNVAFTWIALGIICTYYSKKRRRSS